MLNLHGYIGIVGKEAADLLAKNAATESIPDPPIIPFTDFFSITKQTLIVRHNTS